MLKCFVNSLLSGSFLINSSLSAPTKIEELTAGSDEKNTAQPRRESNPATRFRKTLGSIPGGAALCFFRLIRLSVLLSLSELKEKSWLKCFILITFFQHTCTYDLDTLSFFPPSRLSWSRLHMSVEWPTLNKYETNKQTMCHQSCSLV